MVIKSLYKREYDEFLKPSLVTVTWSSLRERDYKVIMVYTTRVELKSLARLPLVVDSSPLHIVTQILSFTFFHKLLRILPFPRMMLLEISEHFVNTGQN